MVRLAGGEGGVYSLSPATQSLGVSIGVTKDGVRRRGWGGGGGGGGGANSDMGEKGWRGRVMWSA